LNDRGARPRRTFNAPILRSESSTKASSNTASISMAALVNPTNPNADIWSTGLQGAARALTRKPEPIEWDETTTTAAAVPEEAPVEEEASTFTAH